MLLEVVTLAWDVGGNFHARSQSDTTNLTNGRVRLFWGYGIYARADPTTLWRSLEAWRLFLLRLRLSALSNQLVYRRHSAPFDTSYGARFEPRAGYFMTHHTHQVFRGGTNEGRSKNLTRQYMAVLRWRQNGSRQSGEPNARPTAQVYAGSLAVGKLAPPARPTKPFGGPVGQFASNQNGFISPKLLEERTNNYARNVEADLVGAEPTRSVSTPRRSQPCRVPVRWSGIR